MRTRLLVVDDHEVVRLGLREIAEQAQDIVVVGEASSAATAQQLVRACPADALLLDIALPDCSGIQVVEALRAQGIALPVLMFSIHPSAQYARRARQAGAQGFASKDIGMDGLLAAIRTVAAGGISFPSAEQPRSTSAAPDNPFAGLSQRELEVMEGLLRGTSLLDIAAKLRIGAKSVTTYRRRLLDKLGVASNVELAALATRHGYL